MFGLLRQKNPYEQPARAVYRSVVEAARDPVFYRDYAVPDTMEGRFDLMLLHLFVIMYSHQHQQGRIFGQALFDATFAHMGEDLRQAGFGDMGIPKRMRRMMIAFNGRMHAYAQAMQDGTLDVSLARNLYGTVENPPVYVVSAMADYVRDNISFMAEQDFKAIASGNVQFTLIPQETRKYGT
jgi:cytochrome b pre-mRNA-processing protein 3